MAKRIVIKRIVAKGINAKSRNAKRINSKRIVAKKRAATWTAVESKAQIPKSRASICRVEIFFWRGATIFGTFYAMCHFMIFLDLEVLKQGCCLIIMLCCLAANNILTKK